MTQKEYIKQLESALVDVLDGNSYHYEIQGNTGLSLQRCKEIQQLYCTIITKQEV